MRSRSSGQRFASSGISTDGVKMPAAIGIVARALSRNVRRRVMPRLEASSTRERQPRRVDDTHGSARHPLDRDEPDHETAEDGEDSGRPDRHERHRQRDSA